MTNSLDMETVQIPAGSFDREEIILGKLCGAQREAEAKSLLPEYAESGPDE